MPQKVGEGAAVALKEGVIKRKDGVEGWDEALGGTLLCLVAQREKILWNARFIVLVKFKGFNKKIIGDICKVKG